MLIVGLTGGVGSGKSTVARLFADHGARIVDADVIAREVVEPGTRGFDEVVASFGTDVVSSEGTLDRKRLAEIVFSDPEARRELERIVHPKVRAETTRQLSQLPEDSFAVLVVPLLVESGEYPTDKIVVVDCEEEVAIERIVQTRGWTREQARKRIAAQLPRTQRNAAADYVIDNSGDFDELPDAVERCIVWLIEDAFDMVR